MDLKICIVLLCFLFNVLARPQFDYDPLLLGAPLLRKPAGVTNVETNVYTNTNYFDQSRHYTHNITLTKPRKSSRPGGGNKRTTTPQPIKKHTVKPDSNPKSTDKYPRLPYPGQYPDEQNPSQHYPTGQQYPTGGQYPGGQLYPYGNQTPGGEQYPSVQKQPDGQYPIAQPLPNGAGQGKSQGAKGGNQPTVQKWERHDAQINPREYHTQTEYHEKKQYPNYDY